MKTGFLYDPRYLLHRTGQGHPECPERLQFVISHLGRLPWFDRLAGVSSRLAETKWIEAVHAQAYIRRVQAACRQGLSILDTPDVGICRDSFDVALLAAGGALELADQMMKGNIQNGFA
ncbi:MAG TPA: histone deacetylase, partial [bacterium]|nr:histone deacetylase [bacterium]